MNYKLGRLPVKHDPRTLKLEKYLGVELTAPPSINWGKNVTQWGMMMNDSLGDCTCAAAGHLIMTWTRNSGALVTPTDSDIVGAYSAITGYNPSNPNSDNGAIELDVLKYWQNTGIANHKIGAFVSINPQNLNHLRLATWLFGGVYTGVNLTSADMDASEAGKPWIITNNNWEGGHAIPITSYDQDTFQFITWGTTQNATNDWVTGQMEEAYAIISQDWFSNSGLAPSGFDMDQLMADFNVVKS